ncbi:M12 family metallo-peptidase [Pseudomarimonas arenosa]|uniref:Peptidase M12B domain-containing protein n=1 Tax=Pseudomarimonas arenosa TaxID=2774145 RepID=A0AAW3ZL18_9GAMM|nr:M12 family metallo-peptidase [Pseudomarimonas arenosa]MBD8525006.1 hypothetical protein [Pseudomarimonas arenosa]
MRLRYLLAALTLAGGQACPAADLLQAEIGEQVELAPFAYGEQKRFVSPMVLKRIDVYAPHARVLVANQSGLREVERSNLRFFISDNGSASRLLLTLAADDQLISGTVFEPGGIYQFRARLEHGQSLRLLDSQRLSMDDTASQCAQGTLRQPLLRPDQGLSPQALRPVTDKGAGLQRLAIAIDTDNELLQRRFGNNSGTAINYLANLFAGLNLFYERDLGLRVVQGSVILRPSTIADPYPSTGSDSTRDQLNELAEHWRLNHAAIERTLTLQLSGKALNGCQSNGIAYVLNDLNGVLPAQPGLPDGFDDRNYCAAKGFRITDENATFGHYGLVRVFNGLAPCTQFSGSIAAQDVTLVGHELGHLLGVRHSHCTHASGNSPKINVSVGTIDRCYNAEPECYAGPVSCPIDNSEFGQGSLMSYCNFPPPNGAQCLPNSGQVLQEFHPAQQSFLLQRIADNVGSGCIIADDAAVGPTLSPLMPTADSSTALAGGSVGAVSEGQIQFSRSGGTGAGSTSLVCSAAGASLSLVSGSTQTISVGGPVDPVALQFVLSDSEQAGSVVCTATPSNGSVSSFQFHFSVPAGVIQAPCPADTLFRTGFESDEIPCD